MFVSMNIYLSSSLTHKHVNWIIILVLKYVYIEKKIMSRVSCCTLYFAFTNDINIFTIYIVSFVCL